MNQKSILCQYPNGESLSKIELISNTRREFKYVKDKKKGKTFLPMKYFLFEFFVCSVNENLECLRSLNR